jgi:hypothetical protein
MIKFSIKANLNLKMPKCNPFRILIFCQIKFNKKNIKKYGPAVAVAGASSASPSAADCRTKLGPPPSPGSSGRQCRQSPAHSAWHPAKICGMKINLNKN